MLHVLFEQPLYLSRPEEDFAYRLTERLLQKGVDPNERGGY